VLSFFSKIQI